MRAEVSALAVRTPYALVGCDGDRCVADRHDRALGLAISARPLAPLGAWVVLGGDASRFSGADTRGGGPSLGAGLRAGLPGARLRPSISASVEAGWLSGPEDARHQALGLDLRAELAVGEPQGEVGAWGAVSLHPLDRLTLGIPAEDLSLSMVSRVPVGLHLGGELLSSELGPPLSPRTARAHLSMEAHLIESWGVTLRLGVTR